MHKHEMDTKHIRMMTLHSKICEAYACFSLRYDLPNGFTYKFAPRKRFYKLFYLNIYHFNTIHRTTFLSFWIFDFINKIENCHFLIYKGGNKV